MKEGEQNKNEGKSLEDLGKLAQAALSGKKIADVDVIASSKVEAQHLHKFYKSFWMNNFNYSEKSHLDVEVKDTTDSRNSRHSKVVDSVSLHHESDYSTNEFKYAKASVDAVNFTRKLSNVRATECDPDYFENEIMSVVSKADLPNLTVKVIKGKEL